MSNATVQTVVRFVAVCWAGNQTGARCRNPKCGANGLCATHQKMADDNDCPPESPLPHVILFKRKISKSRADKLKKLGIKEEEGKDPVAKFEAAAASAEAQGRAGDAYDINETGRQDDGSLVFDTPGKKGAGAKQISVLKAMMDLGQSYEVTSIHLEPTKDQNPHMRMLIVACTAKHEDVPSVLTDELWEVIASIFTGAFDVWLWANPPKPKTGVVVHTVNLGKIYQKEKPSNPEVMPVADLRFNENERGAWKLEELPLAA